MPQWVLLLRGINVGGKNKLPMADLKSILDSLGATDVQTYVQSGNAVCRSPHRSANKLQDSLAEAIEAERGFRPSVLALGAKRFEEAVASNPFPEAVASPKTLHAFFLASRPKSPDHEGLAALAIPSERFQLVGRVFYLHAPDGFGRSKLAVGAERRLGVEATARNWSTVEALAALVRKG